MTTLPFFAKLFHISMHLSDLFKRIFSIYHADQYPGYNEFFKINKSAGFDLGEHTTDIFFPPVFNKCLHPDLAFLPTASKIISNRASVFVKPFFVKSMVL